MKLLRMAVPLLLLAPSLPAHASTAKACKTSLAQCPLQGCAKDNTPDALTNILKHGHKLSGDPKTLTFQDFASLQSQLEQRFSGKYSKLDKTDRARLRNFSVSSGTVGERDFVQIVGFIAEKPLNPKSRPHPNTGESVNCNLTREDENDYHINLTPKAHDTEFDGIVVEMIPQARNDAWTKERLQAVQDANLQVRARGQLLLDNHHKVNKDEQHPAGGQPRRFSLWEVHPIVEFDVCTAATCAVDSSSWKPLEDWTPPAGSGKKNK